MIENTNQCRYEKEKRRLSLIMNMKKASDKDIIEYLSEEIEQYREKIARMEKDIFETKTSNQIRKLCGLKEIQNEHTTDNEDELEDKNIIMQTTSLYADGRLRETTTRYTYKDEQEAEQKG